MLVAQARLVEQNWIIDNFDNDLILILFTAIYDYYYLNIIHCW